MIYWLIEVGSIFRQTLITFHILSAGLVISLSQNVSSLSRQPQITKVHFSNPASGVILYPVKILPVVSQSLVGGQLQHWQTKSRHFVELTSNVTQYMRLVLSGLISLFHRMLCKNEMNRALGHLCAHIG